MYTNPIIIAVLLEFVAIFAFVMLQIRGQAYVAKVDHTVRQFSFCAFIVTIMLVNLSFLALCAAGGSYERLVYFLKTT